MRRGVMAGVAFIGLALGPAHAFAQVTIPAAASMSLSGGSLDLAGTSLQVDGTFSLGSGNIDNGGSVTIAAGGNIDGGSGTITLSGDWTDLGIFNAGSGTVSFVDGGVALSNVVGDTTFNNASFVSTTGKSYAFAVGSTQTVGGLLTIQGTAAQGIQFKSATAGQVANIDLLPAGSQAIQYVGVSNVHAVGQHLAPNQTNDGGTGDDTGWFGSITGNGVVPTPALGTLGMLLLALLLVCVTYATAAARRKHPTSEGDKP